MTINISFEQMGFSKLCLCVCVYGGGGSLMSLVDCKILYLFAYSRKLKLIVAYDVTDCRIVYLKKSHVS